MSRSFFTFTPQNMDVELPQEDIGYVHAASFNDALTYILFTLDDDLDQLLSLGPDSLSPRSPIRGSLQYSLA